MFELFMYMYSCNALLARFSAVYRALNSYLKNFFYGVILLVGVPHCSDYHLIDTLTVS